MSKRGDGSVDPVKLKALVQRAIDIKAEAADVIGELNSDITVAVETMSLHKQAFNLCVALKKMDEMKRLAFMRAFESYTHILGLDESPQADLEDAIKAVKATGAQMSVVRT